MRIETLPRVIPAPPDRPQVGNADHPMRKVTRQVAFEPGGWTAERRTKVVDLFDSMAPVWDERAAAAEICTPVIDLVARGGELSGPCVELGAGTGRATGPLLERFGSVLAIDVAIEMLRRFREPDAMCVRADSGFMPVRSASVGSLVLVNTFLFPHEVDRVLAPGGALVWVNTLAEDTPIYLPVPDVLAALRGGGEWHALTSDAGWGTWAVVRRGT